MSFNPAPSSFFGSMYGVDDNNRITFQLEGGFGPTDGGFQFSTFSASDEIYMVPSTSSWDLYAPYFTVGNKIKLSASGSVPVGTTNDTEYWIVYSDIDSPAPISYVTIKISETEGGAPINTFVTGGPVYGSDITIVIPPGIGESLPKVTFLDADPTTGDWRVVAFALLDEIANKFKALETANKPARFTCSKKTTGSDDVMVRSYTFSMNLTLPDPAAETILDE